MKQTKSTLRADLAIYERQIIKIMNELYEQYYAVFESNNSDAVLILEGFWEVVNEDNWFTKGVKGVVGGAAKAAGFIKGAAVGGWNALKEKGKELGEKAVAAITKIGEKVAEAAKAALDYVVSFPGKLWGEITNAWSELKTSYENIKKEAGEKAEEIWQAMVTATMNSIVNPISDKWEEIKKITAEKAEALKNAAEDRKTELNILATELSKSAEDKAKAFGEGLIAALKAVEKGAAVTGKWAGLISLGIVCAPILLTVEAGNVAVKAIDAAIKATPEIAKSIAEWGKEIGAHAREKFEEGEAAGKSAFESYVMDFDTYVNERYYVKK